MKTKFDVFLGSLRESDVLNMVNTGNGEAIVIGSHLTGKGTPSSPINWKGFSVVDTEGVSLSSTVKTIQAGNNISVSIVNGALLIDAAASVTIDAELDINSSNAIANNAVAKALATKLTTPEGGVAGQLLSKTDTGYEWVDNVGGGAELPAEQQDAVQWLTANLDRLKDIADYDYVVKSEDIILTPDVSAKVVLTVQGEYQDIDDDGDKDGDAATHYRIDVHGYVLGIETYANNEVQTPDRYYTKVVYEPTSGRDGVSHIYLLKEEYEYFASLNEGKNIIRFTYIKDTLPGTIAVKELIVDLPVYNAEPVYIDIQGNIQNIDDDNDKDGVAATHYRIDVKGYVLDVEGFYNEDSIQAQRFLLKTAYDAQANITSLYFTSDEYNIISKLGNGKNSIQIYYL